MNKIIPLFQVGDVLTNQKGHFRVILEIIFNDKKLTPHYKVMELDSSTFTGGSYFRDWPKGKISTQDIYTFDKFHYLFIIR